jgi:hypothetical protein
MEEDLTLIEGFPKWLLLGLADLHRLTRLRLRAEVILDEMDGFI